MACLEDYTPHFVDPFSLIEEQCHDDDIVVDPIQFSCFAFASFKLKTELFVEFDGGRVRGKNIETHPFKTSVFRRGKRFFEKPGATLSFS